jgi:hypothetical protein
MPPRKHRKKLRVTGKSLCHLQEGIKHENRPRREEHSETADMTLIYLPFMASIWEQRIFIAFFFGHRHDFRLDS